MLRLSKVLKLVLPIIFVVIVGLGIYYFWAMNWQLTHHFIFSNTAVTLSPSQKKNLQEVMTSQEMFTNLPSKLVRYTVDTNKLQFWQNNRSKPVVTGEITANTSLAKQGFFTLVWDKDTWKVESIAVY